MENEKKDLIQRLHEKCNENNNISQDLFKKYNVKRGLRNEDGSGVLVGLTRIASVLGYEKIDEDIVPVEGRLEYRGIDVNDIINGIKQDDRFGFEEVIYLLLFGELPKKREFKEFTDLFVKERHLPENFTRDIILNFRARNIMNSLARATLALYSADPDADSLSIDNQIKQAISLIAKFPVIIVHAYHAMRSKFYNETLFIQPPNDGLMTAENFFHMLRKDHHFTKTEAQVLDVMLMLHADHGGGNNSTFATRVTSSSGTDAYSSISGAIASLKGPLHGGANLSVMTMMEDIKKNVKDWTNKEELKNYIAKLMRCEVGDRSGKIYGFGHAVYTKSDPRAVILKEYAIRLAQEKGHEQELQLYLNMEELVPQTFLEVKQNTKIIAPNVDFFSGFVYNCLGISQDLYTPLFAMARISGWMAHRIEELMVSKRIIRPAYKNVTTRKKYLSPDKRR
ncbi:MAG: citrate synthase [Candidatus Saganbacteria bacterium]|nr:citrate synthase [Candidatus Saganbacteria bacterium]